MAAGVATTGLDHRDGRLLLILAAATLFLSQTRARWVWTLTGFATAVAARQLLTVLGAAGVEAGIGLWVATLGFAGATAVLLRDLLTGLRREGGGDGSGERGARRRR